MPSATASLLAELRDAIGSRKRTKMISPEDTIYVVEFELAMA